MIARLDQTAARPRVPIDGIAVGLPSMETEVVRPPFHERGGEGHADGIAQRRKILEEDLFLKVLRSRRDEDALPAEYRGNQVGECLARAGARFGEQGSSVFDRRGDGGGHPSLSLARLESGQRAGHRTCVGERRTYETAQIQC